MTEPAPGTACPACGGPVVNNRVTITVDRERAIRVYHFTFNGRYDYCSQECAASFFRSWPHLSLSYVTVTQGPGSLAG